MDTNVLLFFEKHQGALPLYEKLEETIQKEIENVTVKVQKTQITFIRNVFLPVYLLPGYGKQRSFRILIWL